MYYLFHKSSQISAPEAINTYGLSLLIQIFNNWSVYRASRCYMVLIKEYEIKV